MKRSRVAPEEPDDSPPSEKTSSGSDKWSNGMFFKKAPRIHMASPMMV
ncbi:hypothetical protein [Luteolibacter yonseiensis]